eukprot:Gb_33141 [translate_table: standard]
MKTGVYFGMALSLLFLFNVGRGSDDNSCVQSIIPCANFLNTTTKPPNSCCTPLLKVIETDAKCLCDLLNTSSKLIAAYGVNLTQALAVPGRCGKNVNASTCESIIGTPTSAPNGANPSGASPPTSGSSSNSNDDTNSAPRLPTFEILPLLALLLLGVSAQVLWLQS